MCASNCKAQIPSRLCGPAHSVFFAEPTRSTPPAHSMLAVLCMAVLVHMCLVAYNIYGAAGCGLGLMVLICQALTCLCKAANWLSTTAAQRPPQTILPPRTIYVCWCVARKRRSRDRRKRCFPVGLVLDVGHTTSNLAPSQGSAAKATSQEANHVTDRAATPDTSLPTPVQPTLHKHQNSRLRRSKTEVLPKT